MSGSRWILAFFATISNCSGIEFFLNTNIVVLVFVACLNLLFNNMNLSFFFSNENHISIQMRQYYLEGHDAQFK